LEKGVSHLSEEQAFSILFEGEFTLYTKRRKVASMKKAIVIFLIVITILALWSLNHSFIVDYEYAQVTGTSAIIFAKADDVSVRTSISVIAKIGSNASLTFANGTQINIVPWASTKFVVYLSKTGTSFRNFGFANAQSGIFLDEEKPFKAAFVSNTTNSYFDTLNTDDFSPFTVYWFRIDGNAWVSISSFGVRL
jgi:hypothetical protein